MTPSQYQREVYEEVGVPNPRYYTKWKLEKQQGPGYAVTLIDDPNAFVPADTEKGDLVEHRKHVKDMYYKVVTICELFPLLQVALSTGACDGT